MIRRTVRLRREYLYKKSLERKESAIYERKQKLKQALEGEPKRKSNFFFTYGKPGFAPCIFDTLILIN